MFKRLLLPLLIVSSACAPFKAPTSPTSPAAPKTSQVTVLNTIGATDCQYTLTGAGIAVSTSAPHVASAVFTTPEALVNADAATALCAGYNLFTLAPASLLSNTVRLGPLVPSTPPPVALPAAPSRADLIAAPNHGMQGETFADATCGTFPWWDLVITTLSAPCRQAAYAMKHAYGDKAIILDLAWSYEEPGILFPGQDGVDWHAELPTLRARILEAVMNGFVVDLRYAGDGESVLTTAGTCAWVSNDPNGATYGELCAEELLPSVFAMLAGDGSTNTTGDLRRFVKHNLGFDGVFYGVQPLEINRWAVTLRVQDPLAAIGLEMAIGKIPLGNGPPDYAPGGLMAAFDYVEVEFENGLPHTGAFTGTGYVGDNIWSVLDRLLGPAYIRAPDQPAGVDVGAPCYTCTVNDQGVAYVVWSFEIDTYGWVRGQVSAADVDAHRAYLASLGSTHIGLTVH